MSALNFIASILTFALGMLVFVNSKSAIHEANAMLLLAVSAIYFTGASICYRISCFRDDLATRVARIEHLLIDQNPQPAPADPEPAES